MIDASPGRPLAPAILRAQAEMQTARENLQTGKQVILDKLHACRQENRTAHPVEIFQAIKDGPTELTPHQVQQAFWHLFAAKAITLDDEGVLHLGAARPAKVL